MKIVLIGLQGSGKSTQGNLLRQKLGVPYLASGDIFRKMAMEESTSGKYVRETLAAGQLVPDDKTISIVEEYLTKPEYEGGYILDGFPRTLVQAQAFKEMIDKVFYIRVSDAEAWKRLKLRLAKQKRADDSPEAIKRRIALFHKMTEPLLDYYRAKQLLIEINGEQTIDKIHQDIIFKIKHG
ncbi:nucleoside monophosphate kinase [Candidatus Microgenomates bacterium]|nr:nucleoside monophosphate kinase [Candidatus Microgenomates bacterium]